MNLLDINADLSSLVSALDEKRSIFYTYEVKTTERMSGSVVYFNFPLLEKKVVFIISRATPWNIYLFSLGIDPEEFPIHTEKKIIKCTHIIFILCAAFVLTYFLMKVNLPNPQLLPIMPNLQELN